MIEELSLDEINKQKNEFKSRRLFLSLPPSHFICVFCDWCGNLTDGYEDYQIMGALWVLSSFCNYKVQVRLKQGTVRPNLFILIFGQSTKSRKSTVVQKTREVYEHVTGILLPNEDFSIEGYLESLDKNPQQHHVRDEAAGLLAKIHKQYNEGYQEFECAVYDGQSFKKTLASKGNKEPKEFNINDPYVTKFYATTPDNYIKYMQVEDFTCGREIRNLFCFPNYPKDKMPLALEEKTDEFRWLEVCDRASKIYDFIQDKKEITFSFDPEALEYYSNITSKLEDEVDKIDDDLLCSAVGRSQIHILKIAMLLELGKEEISTTITEESIEIAAGAVINYFIPTLTNVINRLQEDIKNNQVEKVISVLRRAGGSLQHTRALHNSKLKKKDFDEVIETLIESNTINRVIEKQSRLLYYILTEAQLNLDNFENLSDHQNPLNHRVSQNKENNIINNIKINKYNTDNSYNSAGESGISGIYEISESQEES